MSVCLRGCGAHVKANLENSHNNLLSRRTSFRHDWQATDANRIAAMASSPNPFGILASPIPTEHCPPDWIKEVGRVADCFMHGVFSVRLQVVLKCLVATCFKLFYPSLGSLCMLSVKVLPFWSRHCGGPSDWDVAQKIQPKLSLVWVQTVWTLAL